MFCICFARVCLTSLIFVVFFLGLGGALLQDIRAIVKPTHIISMQDPTDKHPFDFHSQSGWLSENIISNTSSKLLEVQATPGRSSGWVTKSSFKNLKRYHFIFILSIRPVSSGCLLVGNQWLEYANLFEQMSVNWFIDPTYANDELGIIYFHLIVIHLVCFQALYSSTVAW